MANTRHYIDGQDFGEPLDWQDLVITKDWFDSSEDVNINISDLSFVLEARTYLVERMMNGLSGGNGIFEGIPYTIVVGEESSPEYVFNGYLDLTDDATVIGSEELQLSLKKYEGSDWLNDIADSFSFAYLYQQNIITTSDFVGVPYVINYIPDGTQLILLSMSLFMMTKELIENVQKLAEAIGDVTDSTTPVIGVSVGLGAGVVTAWDIGNVILVTIKTIARIAYIIAITIAIKNLIEEIFEQLLPAKRYHQGMTFRKMLEKGCQHLGLNFSSTISELDWTYIPRKDKKGGENGEVGFPINEGTMYTFGDTIREVKKMFNAEHVIENSTLRIERKDKFETDSTFIIPSFFSNQERLLDVNGFNTEEMVANYNITFAQDTQDQNTLDDQTGRVFQAITTPVTVTDEKLVNIKGISQVPIPFSLGKTKTGFTDVENLAKDLGKFVDNLTGIFGGGTNFESKVTSRIGSLLLSSHFLTVGKVVSMSGGTLATDQRSVISSQILWDGYHFINSFAEINGKHNQFWRFKEIKVPMTLQNFGKLLVSNKAKDSDGNDCYLEKMDYTPEENTALIDFRVNQKYTNNLKIEYV